MTKLTPWLSNEQIQALNEKHGYFEFADARGDVSRAFAQDAIDMHERLRAAAPELLAALRNFVDGCSTSVDAASVARAAIAKAEGR